MDGLKRNNSFSTVSSTKSDKKSVKSGSYQEELSNGYYTLNFHYKLTNQICAYIRESDTFSIITKNLKEILSSSEGTDEMIESFIKKNLSGITFFPNDTDNGLELYNDEKKKIYKNLRDKFNEFLKIILNKKNYDGNIEEQSLVEMASFDNKLSNYKNYFENNKIFFITEDLKNYITYLYLIFKCISNTYEDEEINYGFFMSKDINKSYVFNILCEHKVFSSISDLEMFVNSTIGDFENNLDILQNKLQEISNNLEINNDTLKMLDEKYEKKKNYIDTSSETIRNKFNEVIYNKSKMLTKKKKYRFNDYFNKIINYFEDSLISNIKEKVKNIQKINQSLDDNNVIQDLYTKEFLRCIIQFIVKEHIITDVLYKEMTSKCLFRKEYFYKSDNKGQTFLHYAFWIMKNIEREERFERKYPLLNIFRTIDILDLDYTDIICQESIFKCIYKASKSNYFPKSYVEPVLNKLYNSLSDSLFSRLFNKVTNNLKIIKDIENCEIDEDNNISIEITSVISFVRMYKSDDNKFIEYLIKYITLNFNEIEKILYNIYLSFKFFGERTFINRNNINYVEYILNPSNRKWTNYKEEFIEFLKKIFNKLCILLKDNKLTFDLFEIFYYLLDIENYKNLIKYCILKSNDSIDDKNFRIVLRMMRHLDDLDIYKELLSYNTRNLSSKLIFDILENLEYLHLNKILKENNLEEYNNFKIKEKTKLLDSKNISHDLINFRKKNSCIEIKSIFSSKDLIDINLEEILIFNPFFRYNESEEKNELAIDVGTKLGFIQASNDFIRFF